MFDRWIENGLTDVLLQEGVGSIVFSPLAQGVLTNKYLNGVPDGSRASRPELIYLNNKDITPEKIKKVRTLNQIAESRGQTLAQMAIAWTLHNKAVTSCLIGASRPEQIDDSVAALNNLQFSAEELERINKIVA